MDPLTLLLIGAGAAGLLAGGKENVNDITFNLEDDEKIKKFNDYIEPYLDYPDEFSEFKKLIKEGFNYMSCPKCGSRQLKGRNIYVKYRSVELYKEVPKKTFFGGEKYVEEYIKTVYEVLDIYVKNSFFSPESYIKCKNCNWKIKSKMEWLSINDIENMIKGDV